MSAFNFAILTSLLNVLSAKELLIPTNIIKKIRQDLQKDYVSGVVFTETAGRKLTCLPKHRRY